MSTETITKFNPGPAPEPALAELWSRAIASDRDRPAWLDGRRRGFTATDMKVISRSRKSTVRKHLREKAQCVDATFRGNKATEWGNYREQVIIEERHGTEFYQCGLLIQHPTIDYALATPDLAGVALNGELELEEVKTSERKDLNPKGPDFAATRYLEQVLWQLFVTQAARVRLLVEVHDGDWSRWPDRPQGGRGFQEGMSLTDYGPAVLGRYEYVFEAVDYAAEIEAMVEQAKEAMVIYQEELTGVRESGPEEFTDVQRLEYERAVRDYVKGAKQETAGKALKDDSRAELLRLALGGDADEDVLEPKPRRGFSERFDGTLVTFTPEEDGKLGSVPDVESAKAVESEAWERVEAARAELERATLKPKAALTAALDQWEAVQAKYTKKVQGPSTKAAIRVTPKKEQK